MNNEENKGGDALGVVSVIVAVIVIIISLTAVL